jgi:hypothetical protein
MSLPDPAELKRKLRAAGFEVYRSTPELIHLAERVRDNLIMDSGVAAQWDEHAEQMYVRVLVRAQASHYPGATEESVWGHARNLAQTFKEAGYLEEDARTSPVPDPSDPEKTLDISHEIRLHKSVADVDGLFDELRAALSNPRSTGED